MGGYGSGKRPEKEVIEDYCYIDSRRWQREGLLTPGNSFSSHWTGKSQPVAGIIVIVETGLLRLVHNYRKNPDDEPEMLDYHIGLETTSSHYGGARYWFICPGKDCGRRVAKLYSNGHYFACRHCYQLAYASQRESKASRGIRGAGKIRETLGWNPCIISPPEGKPPGMHWKTYLRLMTKQRDYCNDAYQGMVASIKKVNSLLTDLEESLG